MDNDNLKFDLPFFDKCTIITNCTVEILENTETGETSIGWYRSDESEEIEQ